MTDWQRILTGTPEHIFLRQLGTCMPDCTQGAPSEQILYTLIVNYLFPGSRGCPFPVGVSLTSHPAPSDE